MEGKTYRDDSVVLVMVHGRWFDVKPGTWLVVEGGHFDRAEFVSTDGYRYSAFLKHVNIGTARMSLTRRCGACKEPIRQARHVEVTACVYQTDGPEIQDHIEHQYDDYCDACVANGSAMKDLLGGLKYKIARRRRRT